MSKLIAFNTKSDYTEVADSIGDALEVIQSGENAASDGLQVGDLFVVLAAEDEVREIINDGPVFVAQLKQLSPETSRAAALEAGTRVIENGKPVGPVLRFILNSIWGVATGYADAVTILQMGQRQVAEKQELFSGGDIFPPLLAPAA
jgi:hypothetical protein